MADPTPAPKKLPSSNYLTILKVVLAEAVLLKNKKVAAQLAGVVVMIAASLFGVNLTEVEVAGVMAGIGVAAEAVETQLQIKAQVKAARARRG